MNSLICSKATGGGEFFIFVLFIILMLSLVYYIKSKIQDKKNMRKLNVARVVYSANLFDELKSMEMAKVFRLYSQKVSDELYVITTAISGEIYKNGKMISYFGKESKELETKVELLSEFVKKVDKIKIGQFKNQKIGKKIRLGE